MKRGGDYWIEVVDRLALQEKGARNGESWRGLRMRRPKRNLQDRKEN